VKTAYALILMPLVSLLYCASAAVAWPLDKMDSANNIPMIMIRRNVPPSTNNQQVREIIKRTLNNQSKNADQSSRCDVIIVDEGPIGKNFTLSTVSQLDATRDSDLFYHLLSEPLQLRSAPFLPFAKEKEVLKSAEGVVAVFWILYGIYHLVKTLCYEHKTTRILLVGIMKGISFCVIGWLMPTAGDWCWNLAMLSCNVQKL